MKPLHGERGFTLVEVAVALAGAGVLAGGLLTVLVGQSRFQARNDGAVLRQQNVRALSDIMAAEIRSASPHDISIASPDTLGLRSDVLRAVVCDVSGGDVDLFVYDSIGNANLPRRPRGAATSGPYAAVWTYADAFSPSLAPNAAAEASCRSHGADLRGMAPRSAFRRATGWTALPAPTERGTLLRIYGKLQYAFAPSTTDPGRLAVRRNGQELVTPVLPGARFEYVRSDGSVHARVPATDLSDIREVRILLDAATRGLPVAARSVSLHVPLRN